MKASSALTTQAFVGPSLIKDPLDPDQAACHAVRAQQLRAAVKEQKRRQRCQAQGSQGPGKAHGMCLRGIRVQGISCGGAAESGADVFMAAGPDHQGCVDVSRIGKALQASGVLQGLNINKIAEALLCEAKFAHPHKNFHLTLHQFIEVYERVTRGLQRAARQRKIAAKTPQASVPKDWLAKEPLQQVYASACLHGETRRSLRVAAKRVSGMSRHQWLKLCTGTGIMLPDGPVTEAMVDLAFVVAAGRAKPQRLSWHAFCHAIAHMSSDAGYNIVDLMLNQRADE